MPLFEFKCGFCYHKEERLIASHGLMRQQIYTSALLCSTCDNEGRGARWLEPMITAPASVRVERFSSANGFSSQRSINTDHGGGIKTNVRGNFEAFADGLHK